MTLGLASGMVQGFVGEEAGINQVEHYLISTGLADVIANEPLAMKAATKIPLVALLAGLGFWASRCVTIWRDKHPARSRKPAPPTVVQPAASMTPTVENTVPMYERRDPEFTTEPIVGDAWGLPTAVDTPDWYRESQRASFREDNAGLEAIDTNADQDR